MTSYVPSQPVLTARGVSKIYSYGSWPRHSFKALECVDLQLFAGKTLALVGESGAGKSTLALCLAGIEQPDGGEIRIEDRSIDGGSGRQVHKAWRRVQLIWQHASSAMSPYLTAGEIVEEPMLMFGSHSLRERARRVKELLRMVHLPPEWTGRRINQLSGGQRQRLGIARALAGDPLVVILDEPFSGLDLSVRNQILNLLLDLQETQGLAYLYVSHDLEVVRFFADEVAVMESGRIVSRFRPEELTDSGDLGGMCLPCAGIFHDCAEQDSSQGTS